MSKSIAYARILPLSGYWRRVIASIAVAQTLAVSPTLAQAGTVVTPSPANDQTATSAPVKQDLGRLVLHELQALKQTGRVLYVAAHPDDENTELITYLSRGRNYRTAYLSLTRGDGGQNVLGPDIGDKLGVARTQELMAARRIDGGKQYFSRAVDFGFSKDYTETFKVWGKDEILGDTVRVIRQFRPDVIVTRFSTSPGGTHGHHTASAILAAEAFKLAGDPKAYPEQHLAPWQPKRIFWNTSRFQKEKAAGLKTFKTDISGIDGVSGQTFKDVASRSRGMHKTQGFDTMRWPGMDDPIREEGFYQIDGDPVTADIMENIDTSWSRVKGGEAIGKEIDQIIEKFDPKNMSASVPALLALRKEMSALSGGMGQTEVDPLLQEKRADLDIILQQCLGLEVVTSIPHHETVPGETLEMQHTARLTSPLPAGLTVKWKTVKYPLLKKEIKRGDVLKAGADSSFASKETLPASTPVSQPYWLTKEDKVGLFQVDDAKLIGTAENAPAFPIEDTFEINGQELVVKSEPLQITTTGSSHGSRKLDVIPPVSVRFKSGVNIFAPGVSRTENVEIIASREHTKGKLKLNAPANWKIEPKEVHFDLAKAGDRTEYMFSITAPDKLDDDASKNAAEITISAEVGGRQYGTQRDLISYTHLPPQVLQPTARLKVVAFDLARSGITVGYLPGAGDSLPDNLNNMGYNVQILDDGKLTADDLKDLDAVILGVRALNVRKEMGKAMPILLDYVEKGGTLIVQYNRPDNLQAPKFSPYELTISPGRVTDEKATMTFLDAQNQIFNSPNKISDRDFDGWVQERGLYFPNKWDEHFTPLIACNDKGEDPLKGGLLVAKYGKGTYIYTGLAFFRQLPAGVPGAYRLLANMIAASK